MIEQQLIDGLSKLGTAENRQGELAFKHIVDTYQAVIYNTCIGIVGDADDAKDIAQDVFIQLYKSADSFRGDSKISTWLYRIAVNKSLNHIRNNKKHKVLLRIQGFFAADETREIQIRDRARSNPQEISEQNEHKIALRTAIDSFPKIRRLLLCLKTTMIFHIKRLVKLWNFR